jgi:hypothetical protein
MKKFKIVFYERNKTYKARPIRSTSSTVCGNGLFSVSGQSVAKATAMMDVMPKTTIGKCSHTRV